MAHYAASNLCALIVLNKVNHQVKYAQQNL